MKELDRVVREKIENRLRANKVILLLGARRVGKTILIRQLLHNFKGTTLVLNGEDNDALLLLENQSISNYTRLLKGVELLVIDEAQNVPDIGKKLKLIVDEIQGIKIIASGSSSFDLLNQTGEPLVGRSTTFHLFPFSQEEIMPYESLLETQQNLELRLRYGSYPEVVCLASEQEKSAYLLDLVQAYLLRDILVLDGLRSSAKLFDLLKLIAYQMGNEVSYDELARQLGLSKNTVEKYLDLLSKVFIIYRLGGFSRNLRKEVVKTGKWYFYDNGIRNAIISNFAPLALRQDVGALWESYLIGERLKNKHNHLQQTNHHFWRTYDGQELDLIEVDGEELKAFEFKWGNKLPSIPVAFAKAYPAATYNVVNVSNYLDYLESE